MSGAPFPKSAQLARGERRYRRKVASPKQWQAIIAEKGRACRICSTAGVRPNGLTEYHHLVGRAQGGDDTADNIVPLCHGCHFVITQRFARRLELLEWALTEPERAYVVAKLGEDGLRRLFGRGVS